MDRELREEAAAVLGEWRRKEALPDTLSDVALMTGTLSDVLARQIADRRPDFIALGAHTRSPLAAYALGSFAADLVRDPPTDLLLAHP